MSIKRTPTPEVADQVRRLLLAEPAGPVAQRIGVGREQATRVAAGLPVPGGVLALVERALGVERPPVVASPAPSTPPPAAAAGSRAA